MKSRYVLLVAALMVSRLSFVKAEDEGTERIHLVKEQKIAKKIRKEAAKYQNDRPKGDLENNGDEQQVKDYAGNFTKLYQHDPVTGILTKKGQKYYRLLLKALQTGLQKDFNQAKLSNESIRKLVNPQNAFAFTLAGCDSSLFSMSVPPRLKTKWAACEMIEVYLMAISRNVHFADYGTGKNSDADGQGGSLTKTAAAILDSYGKDYKGPRNKNDNVTPEVLFRGTGMGPLAGPYVSQFLYLPVHKIFQPLLEQDQLLPIAQNREFGVAWKDFVSIQNGNVPKDYNKYDFDGENLRYPIDGRDIGTYVHNDGPYDAYYNALNILLYNGFPFAKNLPYQDGDIKNEDPFNTMDGPDVLGLIAEVANEALKAAWCQKWRAFRRLRPEAMAGLAHRAKVTGKNPYDLNKYLFITPNGQDVLQMVYDHNEQQAFLPHNAIPLAEAQTYLLGGMYPELSPAHPTYPAGHAVLAGACTTVIKAIVEDTTLIKDIIQPVVPNPSDPTELIAYTGKDYKKLTVASELDKLASNIALARNFAGVHYRTDGDYGIELGEEVAIRMLQDHARIYNEQGFKGFELTKRNGQRIRITATKVKNIS